MQISLTHSSIPTCLQSIKYSEGWAFMDNAILSQDDELSAYSNSFYM